MKENTIKFNGTDLVLKQSFRSLMLFEAMTGKYATQVNESISDLTKLLYCMLSANNKDVFTYSYDEFIDLLDNNPELLSDFTNYLTAQAKEALPTPAEDNKKKGKK